MRSYDHFQLKIDSFFCSLLTTVFWKCRFIVFKMAKSKANGDKYGHKYQRVLKAQFH